MELLLTVGGAAVIMLIGLCLSAFFSGSETGFYRLSTVRLTIEANAGDRISRRLLRFARRPGQFVATTLVGNNIANYLVSAATGLGVGALFKSEGVVEVVATWAITPVVFVMGELLPKSLYYIAPSHFLRRSGGLFQGFYWLFLPLALPLASISHLLERFTNTAAQPADLVFGRSRLTEVLSEGRQAGLLADAQSRFLTGLLAASGDTVTQSSTPADRVYGLPVNSDRETLLEHARRYGLNEVILSGPDGQWQAYVRVVELSLSSRPVPELVHPLRRFDANQTKLEVLLTLRVHGEIVGAVCQKEQNGRERVIGIVNERGLIEQFFRAGRPLGLAKA